MKIRPFAPEERAYVVTRWLIFAVAIPLLPIAAKVLAEWIDEGRSNWSGSNLFSDGELLVLATVIAAAGIGDLVFDLRRNKRQRSFRDASAIALALICVVVSVTLYALVTLKREQLTPAQEAAAHAVTIQQNNASSLGQQLSANNAQLNAAKQAQDKALADYEAEVNRNPPGNGELTDELRTQYHETVAYTNSLTRESESLHEQFAKSQEALSAAQLRNNNALQGAARGGAILSESNRAAEASEWTFILGLLAGLNCLLAGTIRSHRRSENKNNGFGDTDSTEKVLDVLKRTD
jgi:hypothetical protein